MLRNRVILQCHSIGSQVDTEGLNQSSRSFPLGNIPQIESSPRTDKRQGTTFIKILNMVLAMVQKIDVDLL